MELLKVADLAKRVTDPVMLAALARQGIDQDYVELQNDYAPRSRGKGYSPYSKLYRDLNSDNQFMVVSGLPMVDADGKPVKVGWEANGNGFASRSNLFTVEVDDLETTLSVHNEQPDGRKAGHKATYRPRLFLDGVEQVPVSGNATLLATDPLNGNYSGNTLEWGNQKLKNFRLELKRLGRRNRVRVSDLSPTFYPTASKNTDYGP